MGLFAKNQTSDLIKEGKETAGMLLNKEQGTRRHQTDMLSDSTLSKSVRPIVVIWCLAIMTVIIVFDLKGVKLSDELTATIKVTFWASIGFYFPSRFLEKYLKSKKL